jgi:hypothetical protein
MRGGRPTGTKAFSRRASYASQWGHFHTLIGDWRWRRRRALVDGSLHIFLGHTTTWPCADDRLRIHSMAISESSSHRRYARTRWRARCQRRWCLYLGQYFIGLANPSQQGPDIVLAISVAYDTKQNTGDGRFHFDHCFIRLNRHQQLSFRNIATLTNMPFDHTTFLHRVT